MCRGAEGHDVDIVIFDFFFSIISVTPNKLVAQFYLSVCFLWLLVFYSGQQGA